MAKVRGLIFCALFIAIFAVLSLVQIPVGSVPITLETLVVQVCAGLLGPWYSALTFVLLIVLDLIGLPLIGGHAGPSLMLGPTAGYIWGWPFCALFAGLAISRVRPGSRGEIAKLIAILFVLGDLVCYIPGVLWLRHVVPSLHPWGSALAGGVWPFLPGDFIKSVLAAVIVARVRRVYPTERILRGERYAAESSAAES
ncbi:biotin transporter BioY [Alicyclobacillus acidocaldarius]|uniref:Biotin transporter n=1 Tax=Alicyclobacillus acidocaldarius (strain Tc-4-1) TaxID=1048834 RepID=F8IJT6_ALIAT|nr:biotin transporter BioY [Alicyclobacillus acidocaldarius]AEJ42275.1 BioY protein [Alicyclobacillus acidocaldarius subsp. acidocaldarius Tc-4-1]